MNDDTGCSYSDVDGVWLDGLQFCARVYAMFEALRRQPDATTRFRMRPSQFEKKLLEELLPICRYIQTHYRTGRYISLRWLSGSQPFDTEVVQRGAYVEHYNLASNGYLEVTSAVHANDYLLRERLETQGFVYGVGGLKATGTKRSGNREITSEVVVHSNWDFVHTMSGIVLDRIQSKIAAGYPEHTTLVVQCTLNSLYLPDDWEKLVQAVHSGLPDHGFDEIWLCDDRELFYSSLGHA
ncbi:hypothetical protein PQR05_03875 [Paraburkholderia sediminicola]|uniref:hypothetical protein n=1 Tax=Paraburkholderia sediminicola TaxID=458836 RepID=UPI0038BD62FD